MKHLSVHTSDQSVLLALADVHLRNNQWYSLDCTFSKGVMWKDLKLPYFCTDLIPQTPFTLKQDSTELSLFADESLQSIVFDPPFLFRSAKSVNNDKMCKRFSYFSSYQELLDMYYYSLVAFKRVLIPKGYVFFKCQDMNENKFYCTHYKIIEMATDIGFELKDIAIKTSKHKLQADAKQQSCLAKTHCYWLVFKKKDKK